MDVVGSPAAAGAGVLPPGCGAAQAGSWQIRAGRAAANQARPEGGARLTRWTAPQRGRKTHPSPAARLVDIARIMHAIPHRYPFLLIDRVVDLVRDRSAVGIKNVSVNESFFQGHFPAPSGDAGRAHHRKHGADRGGAGGRDARAGSGRQGGLFHAHRRAPSSAAPWFPAISCASMSTRSAVAATFGSSPPSRVWTVSRWPKRPMPR